MNYLEIRKESDFEIVLSSDIFISNTNKLVMEEISNNMWCLAISSKRLKKINTDQFFNFFDRLFNYYKEQLKKINNSNGAIFYIWFDQKACQLRFNLISDCNEKLPFGCELLFVHDIKEIINDFINSPYHDGIPWEELEIYSGEDFCEDDDNEIHILKVFKKHIEVG